MASGLLPKQSWLERARESTCRELSLEVKRSRPGSKPRDPEDRKGLAEIRFPISVEVSALAFQKWELAKKQLSEERGTAISDAECMEILASLLLSTEEDGSLPGRKRARSSLFRLVVHQGGSEETGGHRCYVAGKVAGSDASGGSRKSREPHAVLETEEGPVPLDGATLASLSCDAETIREVDGAAQGMAQGLAQEKAQELARDGKTSSALRERVLTRDGHCCRSCRSRYDLMVHHIRERSQGGPTRADNLISLCMLCHGLVHADLLVLDGGHQARVRFMDREGRSLHAAGKPLPASALTRLTRHRDADAHQDPIGQSLSRSLARRLSRNHARNHSRNHTRRPADKTATPEACPSQPELLTLDNLPAEVDVGWWRKHGHLFEQGKGGHFRFRPGFAVESPRPAYSLCALPVGKGQPRTRSRAPATSAVPWPQRIGHPAPGHEAVLARAKTADVRRFAGAKNGTWVSGCGLPCASLIGRPRWAAGRLRGEGARAWQACHRRSQ